MPKFAHLAGMALVATLGFAASAQADTLTFEGLICNNGGNICSNGQTILQSYGDVTGQLDVQYDSDIASAGETAFSYWADSYSGMFDVAYGGSGATVEIYLQPLSGYQVTLLGFDLGAWPNQNRNSQVTILGGNGSAISSTGPITIFGNGPTSFAPGLTRTDGFRLQFGPDAFNVGIDNISFEISRAGPGGVPEPTIWAMMILGFGAAGSMIRRRRAVSIA